MSLRILLVGTAVEFSISDSARGYHRALIRQGHQVHLFNTSARIAFNNLALKHSRHPHLADDYVLSSRLASEGLVVEALRWRADLVVVACGLGLHPDGLELLNRAGFPSALILTESPYDDLPQQEFARHCGHVFTNDRYSAREFGWHYLGSAYDPYFHHPFPPKAADACDVLFVGTGWPDRQALLEGVDWTGINLMLRGVFPGITEDSPLRPFYVEEVITNDETAQMYSSAKIALVHHRGSDVAESLGPRSYEVGACGAFQISDWRAEMADVYGDTVPIYRDAADLDRLIRYMLKHDIARQRQARAQHDLVVSGHHTFDDRAAELMAVVTGQTLAAV